MHTWVDIATLTKKKVHQARFVARMAANLFYSPEVGVEVAFVPPRLDAPRRAFVAEVGEAFKGSYEVAFSFEEGPWSDEALDSLVGCHCLVPRESAEGLGENVERPSVAGFKVIDAALGLVGTALRIESYPGQDMLIAKQADGSELLIPYVDAFVLQVDANEGIIQVALPAGLLDLAQGSENKEQP